MRRFMTDTRFIPLKVVVDGMQDPRYETKDGKVKTFKTRAAVEKFCKEHRCMYVEEKHVFYK